MRPCFVFLRPALDGLGGYARGPSGAGSHEQQTPDANVMEPPFSGAVVCRLVQRIPGGLYYSPAAKPPTPRPQAHGTTTTADGRGARKPNGPRAAPFAARSSARRDGRGGAGAPPGAGRISTARAHQRGRGQGRNERAGTALIWSFPGCFRSARSTLKRRSFT